jgi:D-glycero-alpha-D-manno-heptose-7-phosphate kinase
VSSIHALARCRVDLAGGTLDIWPLGVLHARSATVNVAIDLPVSVVLRPRSRGWSVEQDGERVEAQRLAELASRPETALVACVLEETAMTPCALELASASPRGAGLGASSALTVALLAAVESAQRGRLERTPAERAALARDLEARLMALPTGRQDHFPAQLGGALAIEHRAGGETARRLDADLGSLGERLLVAHTGQSHFSAANNWQVIRGRLDGDAAAAARLDAVRDAALRAVAALERGDWPELGRSVAADWSARRGLADGISTPAIERLLEAAEARGAWGGKACGAGGGGCVAVLCPPERRAAIAAEWRAQGAPLLEAPPTAKGLEVFAEPA